jgi:hypothetical protein
MDASHSVVEEIIKAFEESDSRGIDACSKYAKRYSGDYMLQKVKRLLAEYEESRGLEKLNQARKLLDVIRDSRRFQTAGGHGLAVKDRRRFKPHQRRR